MPRSEQTLTSKVNQDNRTDSWYELGNKSEAGGLTTIEVASNRFPFLIEIRLKKEREREREVTIQEMIYLVMAAAHRIGWNSRQTSETARKPQ